MKASEILGINARNKLFSYVYNSAKGKNIAASKLKTKKYLKKQGFLFLKFMPSLRILTRSGILIGTVFLQALL